MDKKALMIAVACVFILLWQEASTQPPTQRYGPSFQNQRFENQRNRISGERVSRQAEVLRLEQIIERLETRVLKLERAVLGNDRFPTTTVVEAEAALRYAESQLEQRQRQLKKEEVSRPHVESSRLAVVRAQAQLQLAKAAHQDRLWQLEVELLDAEDALATETGNLQHLERLLARGHGTKENLARQRRKVAKVQTAFDRAKSRLDLHRSLDGDPLKDG